MKTLIIIPAYNEEKNIESTIKDIRSSSIEADILVINDCSLDNTQTIVEKIKDIVTINLPINLGIGGAVQTGFKYARNNDYDIAVQFDGDGQHKASEIKKIVQPLINNDVDVMIGSRFLIKESSFKSSFMRRKGIFIFKCVNKLLTGQTITDNTSGFRAYNKKTIAFLAKYYPEDYPEPESIVLLGKNNFRMKEVSVDMQERAFGKSSIYGWRTVYYMLKVLLGILMAALRKPVSRD